MERTLVGDATKWCKIERLLSFGAANGFRSVEG
jgi:hypothetical protein